ncbi:hypothetical protein ABKN59_001712 [Abortiporus biennis]
MINRTPRNRSSSVDSVGGWARATECRVYSKFLVRIRVDRRRGIRTTIDSSDFPDLVYPLTTLNIIFRSADLQRLVTFAGFKFQSNHSPGN